MTITIETLRSEFAGIKSVSFENAKKLTDFLNKTNDDFIVELIHAKINILSRLAINHAVRRGLIA